MVAFIGAGIPIPNGLDFLVILLSVKEPASAPLWVTIAVLGSSGGNLTIFFLSRKGGQRLLKSVAPVGYRRRFRMWLHRNDQVQVFIHKLNTFPMHLKFLELYS